MKRSALQRLLRSSVKGPELETDPGVETIHDLLSGVHIGLATG
jgi:hypothetical protein